MIYLYREDRGVTIFGRGYLLWWYTLKGPKFMVVRTEESGD